MTPLPGAYNSHGECYARVASLPTPSPCDRPDRLGLLWVGLTPSRSRPQLPLVEYRRPAQEAGLATRSPEVEVPPFCQSAPGVHHLRFSVTVPRSYSTPMGPARARHGARADAAFPLTLQGRLPHVAAYGAVSILGEVRTPLRPGHFYPFGLFGLAPLLMDGSLCTLRRCCSASPHATPVGATSGNDLGHAAISREF